MLTPLTGSIVLLVCTKAAYQLDVVPEAKYWNAGAEPPDDAAPVSV